MGTSYRLTIAFVGVTLTSLAMAVPVTEQAAQLDLTSEALVLTSGQFACPVGMADATLTKAGTPDWIASLTPDTWGEISGTNLSTAGVRQAQFILGTSENPVNGWGGWAMNGLTAYLTGGGHTDGPDNSVYKIDLSADSPAWSRAVDGSAEADWVQYHTISGNAKIASYNLDDRPGAAHIYHWMSYAGGKIVRYRYFQSYGPTLGYAMSIAPLGQGWTNHLNPATGAWSIASIAPSWTSSDEGSGNPWARNGMVTDGTLIYAVWQNINYGSGVRLMSYNPETDTYAVIGPDHGAIATTYGGVVYDTSRGEMVLIPEGGAVLQRFNLSTGALTTTSLTGAQSAFSTGWNSSYMGACYDSTRDLYYAYAGQSVTGQTLYQIDPANSYAATLVSTSGTPTTTVASGINSRMVYLADHDVIVMQPAWNSGLWALKRS